MDIFKDTWTTAVSTFIVFMGYIYISLTVVTNSDGILMVCFEGGAQKD